MTDVVLQLMDFVLKMMNLQRLLCAKLDGELAPADASRAAKTSCWRSLLLGMLEETVTEETVGFQWISRSRILILLPAILIFD